MPGKILVDSSFLYALYDQSDAKHPSARAFAQANSDTLVIPEVTLPEVAFLVNRAGGIPGVLRWLDALIEVQQTFEPILISDIQRARSIMATYADSRFDFVDCCIMALAERLHITQVCTFDRRDFAIFRPSHCPYLEMLPH